MKKREPIKEARRYVDNAREILDERGKLDDAIRFRHCQSYHRPLRDHDACGLI